MTTKAVLWLVLIQESRTQSRLPLDDCADLRRAWGDTAFERPRLRVEPVRVSEDVGRDVEARDGVLSLADVECP